MDYVLTKERRQQYRKASFDSNIAKKRALAGLGPKPIHDINKPKLAPEDLMPLHGPNGLRALSLFSGGGGFDLGFDRAGFEHVASYDILDICGETLRHNRPDWNVYAGDIEGDVKNVDWKAYKGKVDVIHGGPPCQPFSIAGSQRGEDDERNMWPEFIKAINDIKPLAFIAENVPGILNKKFASFIEDQILNKLPDYKIVFFKISSAMYGVPQDRQRVIFIGFRNKKHANNFEIPRQTHLYEHLLKRKSRSMQQEGLFADNKTLPKTMGVREALGLKDIGHDAMAPTIRSAFTGKRNTTSILNGKSGQEYWAKLELWPSGVSANRELARNFLPKNKHRRLSVQDCGILQGFPASWEFQGPVYKVLGQIGNSVAPPKAYAIAMNIFKALQS